jgi:hypothetical protein
MRRLLLAPALLAVLVVAVPAQAEPGRVFRETVHLDDLNEIEDFCESGLTIQSHLVADIGVKVMPRGRDGLSYFAQHVRITETFTNSATGKSVVSAVTGIDKDLRVTDNGDGTFTILVLSTGNAVVTDASGKAIARNPGQTRFLLVIDDNGTPDDPSDDTELSAEIVKGSTGRTDDFCGAVVPALS